MTTLSFRTDPYTLSDANQYIGEVYEAIVSPSGLPSLGFAKPSNEAGHVFAENNGTLIDIFYLFNGGRSFWQVIACSGDQQAANDQLLSQVGTMIQNLKFL